MKFFRVLKQFHLLFMDFRKNNKNKILIILQKFSSLAPLCGNVIYCAIKLWQTPLICIYNPYEHKSPQILIKSTVQSCMSGEAWGWIFTTLSSHVFSHFTHLNPSLFLLHMTHGQFVSSIRTNRFSIYELE